MPTFANSAWALLLCVWLVTMGLYMVARASRLTQKWNAQDPFNGVVPRNYVPALRLMGLVAALAGFGVALLIFRGA